MTLLGAREYELSAKKAALAPAEAILAEVLKDLEEVALRKVLAGAVTPEAAQLALLEVKCYRSVMARVRQLLAEELQPR